MTDTTSTTPPVPGGGPPLDNRLTMAASAVGLAQHRLHAEVLAAVRERGVSEAQAARDAGLSRTFVRKLLGKA